MISGNSNSNREPVAVVGAGDLISHLFRTTNDMSEAEYRFGLMRLETDLEATHSLRSSDLRDIVKLCQVLAISILDDGWLDGNQSFVIEELVQSLDEITHHWNETNYG